MITEDYVSFEIAKLLKKKGFDEHCFCVNYPLPEGEHHSIILPNLLNNSMIPFTDEYKFCRYKEDFITIPTLQMTMKWLREVHNIHIELNWDKGNQLYSFHIWKSGKFQPEISSLDLWRIYKDDNYIGEWNYETACETAIKYCLENLI